MTDQHDIVLVARDRSGACTDQIVKALDTAHLAAVLQPVLAADAVLCTDSSAALAAAARHIGVEHHAINASIGLQLIGPWHINNVNGYYSRIKEPDAQIQRRGLFVSAPLPQLVPGIAGTTAYAPQSQTAISGFTRPPAAVGLHRMGVSSAQVTFPDELSGNHIQ